MERSRNSTITVQGTVRAVRPAGASTSRQVTIVTPLGVVYDVEPTFIGATLWRLEGYRVAAKAQLVRVTGVHPIIRVASLTIFGRDRADALPAAPPSMANGAVPSIDAEQQSLDLGGIES